MEARHTAESPLHLVCSLQNLAYTGLKHDSSFLRNLHTWGKVSCSWMALSRLSLAARRLALTWERHSSISSTAVLWGSSLEYWSWRKEKCRGSDLIQMMLSSRLCSQSPRKGLQLPEMNKL